MKVTGIKAIHVLPGGLIFTTNTGLQGNYTNELQIRPKKKTTTYIYMSKQPLDVSD